ncbi:MAG: methylenetetrahydrofolate reductase [Planctomycetota bacterium]|jgi:methylenetetrahydrofolate reductase (NADPH)
MSIRAESNLERVLSAGHLAVTAEVGPPRSPDPDKIRKKADLVRDIADAYNVTDNQTAVVRMSSIAGAKILLDEGLEPVMQMVCRDRNRIAIQSDLLGASALGLRNCLCISGDHQSAGAGGKLKGHPGAKNVFDVDSVQLISIVKGLRDEGIQEGGDSISPAAPFFIGAAWTPLGPPASFRIIRLAKKIEAGADFIQTQAVYDVAQFAEAVSRARDMGLTERTAILVGIIVPRSARMLRYMNANVPGVVVPDALIERMKSASDAKAEGIKITIELIEAVKEIPGIRGIHLQAIEAEELLTDIVESAGLLPRPRIE